MGEQIDYPSDEGRNLRKTTERILGYTIDFLDSIYASEFPDNALVMLKDDFGQNVAALLGIQPVPNLAGIYGITQLAANVIDSRQSIRMIDEFSAQFPNIPLILDPKFASGIIASGTTIFEGANGHYHLLYRDENILEVFTP